MSKKAREKKGGGTPAPEPPRDGITPAGKKVIGAGAALVVLGFIALSKADPMGRNTASLLSSFLLVGGYAAIGFGIFLPPKSSQLPTASSQDLPQS
jgi:hypothetical protein